MKSDMDVPVNRKNTFAYLENCSIMFIRRLHKSGPSLGAPVKNLGTNVTTLYLLVET